MIWVKRSFPAPQSLAAEALKPDGKYNLPDVTEQLRRDFYDKCYICEIKPVSDPEVEHRLPHRNNTIPGRKYDWGNLFWACRHCNNVKNKAKYEAGILDCCKVDPEDSIRIELIEDAVIVQAIQTEPQTLLTVQLLDETYNEKNTGIRIAACDARIRMMQNEMGKLYKALMEFRMNPESGKTSRKLKVLLSRESAFAAVKRDYIRKHLMEYPELVKYLR